MIWENAVEYHRNSEMVELAQNFANLCHFVQHHWKLTSRDFWSSRNKRKPFSKQKWCFEKNVVGYLRNGECWSFPNLCHFVLHPWKLTSRDFWSSRTERKPLSKEKCVFWETCCGVSQKWWVLELSNLYHCVLHPWKLTSRDFWSPKNKRKLLSKQKCVLRKCCGVSQKQWMSRAFKTMPLCSAPLKTY